MGALYACSAAACGGPSSKPSGAGDGGADILDAVDARDSGPDVDEAGGATLDAPSSHRSVATPCPPTRPSATCDPAPPGPPPIGAECIVDGDCKDGQNGLCVHESPNVGGCTVCSYDECFADGDCKTGGPCDCGASRVGRNTCRAGNCRIDADCGPGGYCSLSPGPCPGYDEYSAWAVGYFCRTPKDACREDADCSKPGYIEQCRYDQAAAAWRCFDWPGCPT